MRPRFGPEFYGALILLVGVLLVGGKPLAAGEATVSVEKPAMLRVPVGPDEVERLARGDERLTLVVKSFQPPARGGVGFVVYLVDPKSGTRREVTRFGLFPADAFSAEEAPGGQRFDINLSRARPLTTDTSELSLEVVLEPHQGSGEGASAVVDVEVR